MKTFRRDRLKRLVEQGKVVLVGSYNFDDMHGESRSQGIEMPCAMKPADWRDRQEGICYFSDHDFNSGSGRAWVNPNGTITLYVHSNHNVTLRIKE